MFARISNFSLFCALFLLAACSSDESTVVEPIGTAESSGYENLSTSSASISASSGRKICDVNCLQERLDEADACDGYVYKMSILTSNNLFCGDEFLGNMVTVQRDSFVTDYICDSASKAWRWAHLKDYERTEMFNPNIEYDTFVDSRDGNAYKTVKIGDQVWMAENLRYIAGNGTYYRTEYFDKMGCYYTFSKALDIAKTKTDSVMDFTLKGICPEGWHVPSVEEWRVLEKTVGSIGALKSSVGWFEKGTNASGFSAVPSHYNDNCTINACQSTVYFQAAKKKTFEGAFYWEESLWIMNEERFGFDVVSSTDPLVGYCHTYDTCANRMVRCVKD